MPAPHCRNGSCRYVWAKLFPWLIVPATCITRGHCLATYRKVASSRLSRLVAHSRIFSLFMKGDIWCLCTVTFSQKSSKLNSRTVNYSRHYSSRNAISLLLEGWFPVLFNNFLMKCFWLLMVPFFCLERLRHDRVSNEEL